MIPASAILDHFPPSERIYGVLDGARDPRLRRWLIDTQLPGWCLYRGKLPPRLEDAAPWLVALPRGHAASGQILERIWGGACGVLLSTSLPSKELRRHLRRFLLAQTERGQVLLFRYYDPRVLRVYVPTLTADEAKEFFGGISTWLAEGVEPGQVHLFRRDSLTGTVAAASGVR